VAAALSALLVPCARASGPVEVTVTDPAHRQALSPQRPIEFTARRPRRGTRLISVDGQRRYQTFIGIGAAMTDSSAFLLWDELSAANRDRALDELFGADGLRLSFLRVPMGASDFTAGRIPYTYDDMPAGQSDPSLSGFTIAHDEDYVIPALLEARRLNPELYLEAVPWTAPAWMKANDRLSNFRHRGRLRPEDASPWAQYFVRFLQAYANAGLTIDAISPQNEPGVKTLYPGMELDQAEETAFVGDYLAPALAAAGLRPSIFGWDLSWGPLRASNPTIRATHDLLAGVAWHCYYGSPHVMNLVHAENPAVQQIVDECSPGSPTLPPLGQLLIASLRNGASAFAAWNLALDPRGEPVQPPNRGCPACTGLLTVDEASGTFSPTPDLFALGQVSRFVVPGAVRIATPHFVSYGLSKLNQTAVTPGLDDVAFANPDGSKVLITLNTASRPISFAIRWAGRFASYRLGPGATATFLWR
jgi:glucosylceramidase